MNSCLFLTKTRAEFGVSSIASITILISLCNDLSATFLRLSWPELKRATPVVAPLTQHVPWQKLPVVSCQLESFPFAMEIDFAV